jgi:hypothetical protein
VVLNTEGDGVVVHELIGEVALDETAFATAGVSDYDDFEDEIVPGGVIGHQYILVFIYMVIQWWKYMKGLSALHSCN